MRLKERIAVDRVLRSGRLAQGSEVQAFENEFSKTVLNRECVATNSGTSSLHLALLSHGIGPGDEVIVPSFTFAATANSVALTGAKPVFVDIDLDTFNMNPAAVEAALSPKTKAIQPVHLYGLPANMPEILRIAEKHKLLVFEDAAQAHLAKINGTPVGSFGDSASFSFYPTKNMTSGEGGMTVFSSASAANSCRLYRNQGMQKRYENELVGFNLRMTDVHAAIGRVQLGRLPTFTKRRQENAKFFLESIKNVVVPASPIGFEHVYHQFTLRIEGQSRDSFASELRRLGVDNGIYYPKPVHSLPSYALSLDLPNTRTACEQVLSIPVHPQLNQRELESIVTAINKVARAGS